MTTMYSNGRFWVIYATTGSLVAYLPSYATWQEARTAIGPMWVDADEF